MKLTGDERVLYIGDVWLMFERKTGKERDASSVEYDLICRWMNRGIPLPVVLRGIEETTGKPRTLLACERPVERAISYWHQAVGGLTELPEAGLLENEVPL